MKVKINPTPKEINDAIISVFERFRSGCLGGSKGFEITFHDQLGNVLEPLGFQSEKGGQWKDRGPALIKAGVPLLVYQKNGSQRPPDTSIIYGDMELSIENKSSKGGQIVWNGGLPTPKTVYLIVQTKTSKVTFAMGYDMLHPKHYDALRNFHQNVHAFVAASKFNETIVADGCPITYYARAMYQDPRQWFGDAQTQTKREQNVISFLGELTWPSKTSLLTQSVK